MRRVIVSHVILHKRHKKQPRSFRDLHLHEYDKLRFRDPSEHKHIHADPSLPLKHCGIVKAEKAPTTNKNERANPIDAKPTGPIILHKTKD